MINKKFDNNHMKKTEIRALTCNGIGLIRCGEDNTIHVAGAHDPILPCEVAEKTELGFFCFLLFFFLASNPSLVCNRLLSM